VERPLTPQDFLQLYKRLGLSIIPVSKDRVSLIDWREFQQRQPTHEELESWFGGAERPNVAVVCGRVSGGLVILDFEREDDFTTFFKNEELLKQTLVVRTPHGGIHVWLREAGEVPRRSIRISEDPPLDLLGEGGYAVAPPSIIDHARCKKGKCRLEGLGQYHVISSSLEILTIKGIYQAVLQRAKSLGWRLKEKPQVDEILQGVPEGMRNESAFHYARYLLFKIGLDPQAVWVELQRWNSLNNPPLPEAELRTVWQSAQRYPYPKPGTVLLEESGDEVLRPAVKFKFIRLIFSKPIIKFDPQGNLLGVETEFRLYKAWKEEGQQPFIILDRDGYVNPKRLEYALRRVEGVEADEILSQARNVLNQDRKAVKDPSILLEPVPRLKSVEFLRGMDWEAFVNEILDYKNVGVDPDFKIVRMATLPRGIIQSINPHAQVVLPGQTGKSEYYNAIGTLEDKVSDHSLVGYADTEGPKPGSLDKTELPFAFDQVESLTRGNILRYLSNIMERGEAIVDTAAQPFSIWSKSTLIFLSNPIGQPKSQYPIFLEKLCRNPTLGRRFGIILYKNEAKRIASREKDLKGELSDKIALYRAVEEYALSEIKKIVFHERVWKWLNEKNEEWVKQALTLLEDLPTENEELALFLKEFIMNGGTHTRGAALNCAIVKNLAKIALKEQDLDDLLRDAEEYLAEILRINFNSIQAITENYRQGLQDLMKRTFDTLPTYLKEIISAVELWRRNLGEEEKQRTPIPHKLLLEALPYTPKSTQYFSLILKDARKGNPGRHNPDLKAYFHLEIEKGDGGNPYAVVWSLNPITIIEPLGSWQTQGTSRDNRDNSPVFGNPGNFPKKFQGPSQGGGFGNLGNLEDFRRGGGVVASQKTDPPYT
jgi:hypothetical protein